MEITPRKRKKNAFRVCGGNIACLSLILLRKIRISITASYNMDLYNDNIK